jgi:hypothetical protein
VQDAGDQCLVGHAFGQSLDLNVLQIARRDDLDFKRIRLRLRR